MPLPIVELGLAQRIPLVLVLGLQVPAQRPQRILRDIHFVFAVELDLGPIRHWSDILGFGGRRRSLLWVLIESHQTSRFDAPQPSRFLAVVRHEQRQCLVLLEVPHRFDQRTDVRGPLLFLFEFIRLHR